MTRLTLTLATWLVLASVGSLALTPRPAAAAVASPSESEPEFVITASTVVYLDGERCAYKKVPADASIVSMDVAADRKTVLEVHFRTRK